jgi:hypothetical protein
MNHYKSITTTVTFSDLNQSVQSNQYVKMNIDVQRRKLYHAELARREENNEPLITYQEWFEDQDRTWIYESPDKGNTIYRRKFFESPQNRELVDNGKRK